MERREYGDGTFLVTRMPWSTFTGGAALCTDGKVRTLKRIAPTADTFFSVPASVVVKGKTVAGYVTVESREGWSTTTGADPGVVKFFAYQYRANGHLLPAVKAPASLEFAATAAQQQQ